MQVKPTVTIQKATSSSSESARDEAEANGVKFKKKSFGKRESRSSEKQDSSNTQLVLKKDQCCPGFVVSKSGKIRSPNSGCNLS